MSQISEPSFSPENSRRAPGRAGRMGLWALGLGFAGMLVWVGLAPLDEGVPAHGVVTIDTKSKAVQHLTGGLIKQVLVGEGAMVKAGDLLLVLDDAVTRANHEDVRQRYLGLRAIQGRLVAEQTGGVNISFHPDLVAAASDPLIKAQMETQQQLFQTRQAALRSDLQGIEESILGQQAAIASAAEVLRSRQSQLALVREELSSTRGLVTDGYVPRTRMLELERTEADLLAVLAEVKGNSERAQRTVYELRQRALSRKGEYLKEVGSQLGDVMRQVQADADKLVAVKADLARAEIRSPASGQIVGLAVQTIGAVVQAGQKLMDIVPPDEPLLIEARIEPRLIDKLHAGLKTDVRFTAFAHSPQLVVEGEVVSISGDLLTDPHTGMSFYLARIRVTSDGMKVLGKRRMQPGMPAEVVVKTGERTVFTYLAGPLIKRLASSMKEE